MGRDRVLVAFVDALGPEILARAGAEAFRFLPHRGALEGVLGYSSGALATILTGSPPSAHGRMCLFTRRGPGADGVLDPLRWLGLLPRIVHERSRVRGRVARWLAAHAGLEGYVALHRVPPAAFSWLDLPERDDLFAAPDVGGVPTFLAEARAAGLSVYSSPWQRPERERLDVAVADVARLLPDLTFLYAAELDATLHRGGSAAPEAAGVIERISSRVGRVRDALGAGGARVHTLVVGDHGMADVERVIDPRTLLRGLGARRAFVDSTMLRLWGDARELARARQAIERAGWPVRWLDRAALEAREAPVVGAPYGDAIALLAEGAIFAPSWVGGRVAGMHGYDPGSPSTRAAVLSDVPIDAGVRDLQDVRGWVRAGLGLGPGPIAGGAGCASRS